MHSCFCKFVCFKMENISACVGQVVLKPQAASLPFISFLRALAKSDEFQYQRLILMSCEGKLFQIGMS